MWEAENTDGRPTPFAYVYLPSGTEQPSALQDPERCGQNVFQGAFPTLQVRPACRRWQYATNGLRCTAACG